MLRGYCAIPFNKPRKTEYIFQGLSNLGAWESFNKLCKRLVIPLGYFQSENFGNSWNEWLRQQDIKR